MLLGALFYDLITSMIFTIPGSDIKARIFADVVTEDTQYDIYDVGIEHPNGGIDSIAFGGSCYSLKRGIEAINRNGRERREKNAADKSSD